MNDEVLIVGGGPSLEGFDFGTLRGRDTIAVNYSIFAAPFATYFVTLDRTFFDKVARRHTEFKKMPAVKVLVNNMGDPIHEDAGEILVRGKKRFDFSDFTMIVRSTRADGIGRSFLDFRHGYNSGYCALQLAVLLGYRRIGLLGIDLGSLGGKVHYHNDYRVNWNCMPLYARYFSSGLRDLKENWPDVEVVSHSPISPLNGMIRFEPFAPALSQPDGAPTPPLDSPDVLSPSSAGLPASARPRSESLVARIFLACRRLLFASK